MNVLRGEEIVDDAPGGRTRLEEHERLLRQILGRHHPVARQSMFRWGHQQQLFAQSGHRHQIRLFDRQREQSGIHTARADLLHRLAGCGDGQAHVKAGMNAAQVLQQRRKDVQAHRHAAGQAKCSTELAGAIGDLAERLPHVLKDPLPELDEALGGRRHSDLPADPQEQRLAQLLFEQQDLTADGGLRHVEPPAARGKRSGLGDRSEYLELAKVQFQWAVFRNVTPWASGPLAVTTATPIITVAARTPIDCA